MMTTQRPVPPLRPSVPPSLQTGPWVRPIADAATQLGIDPAVYALLARHAVNCWWMQNETRFVSRRDAIAINAWVERMGILSVLQDPAVSPVTTIASLETEDDPNDCLPAPDPAEAVCEQTRQLVAASAVEVATNAACGGRSEADVERIRHLIADNVEFFEGRYGRWAIGEVLRLLWESKPARRVLADRGIALGDLRRAMRRALGKQVGVRHGADFRNDVITELSRLHRGRLAYLFVEHRKGVPVLVARAQSVTSQRKPSSNSRTAGNRPTIEHEVGQIVWVAVEETSNGRKSRKRHPAVLLARTGRNNAKWLVLTMTSDAPSGAEFRRVPDAAALGLDHGGFVWHEVQKMHKSQIENVAGWIHRPLLAVVDRVVDLRKPLRDELARIADLHHERVGHHAFG